MPIIAGYPTVMTLASYDSFNVERC